MSVEGRRPRHKPDGDSHNGSAADSDSARGSSILSSPTTPQQPSCCGFSLRGVAQLVARLVRDQEAGGSSPPTPTILTKRYRCVWRKARRINRFRAFSGLDSFFQTIDANRCFRVSAPIRTGRFPVSCRCVQPAPFFSGDFSGWQRYFSQKRIIKIWASFCWS